MQNLYLLTENINNGSNDLFLNVLSVAAILSGLLVIISKNPIVSVLFLIGLFLTISGYLMMLGLNFIGLSYLLVYVGAVSILFLFILMLINIRISELVSDTSNSLPLAIIIGIVFNSIIYYDNLSSFNNKDNILNFFKKTLFNNEDNILNNSTLYTSNLNGLLTSSNNETLNDISYVSSNLWDGSLAETTHITTLGNVIYTAYPLLLIITSIILLLAMVGAIVITIKQKD